jgi:hypothetical protein
MKTFNLALIATLLVLFFGCQENIINEPDTAKIQKHNLTIDHSLKICCEVRDPRYGACNLNGCVNYTFDVIEEAMHASAVTMVSLKIYLNAVLCDNLGMVHLEWRAEGRSEEIVYVSEEGIALIEKSYPVTNRPDIVLLVQYLVTTNGIGISRAVIVPLED